MAEDEMCFDDNFVDLPGFKDVSSFQCPLASAPSDPLYNLIDSDRYVRNLENKLKKLKGGRKEPTAKDMILSLEKSKEDHFRRLEQFKEDYVSNFVPDSMTMDTESSYSYLQRKIHPDRVAIDPEELVELLQDNDTGKEDSSGKKDKDTASGSSGFTDNSVTSAETKTESVTTSEQKCLDTRGTGKPS